MTRMFGLMLNDPQRAHDFLVQHADVLSPPRNLRCDGYGIGFYQDDRALLSKRPRIEGVNETYAEIAKDIFSDIIIVHAREATIGPWGTKNMHPFRFQSWLMAHTGTVEGLPENREEILKTLPAHLGNNVKGDTDSELVFHYFLAKLSAEERLDNPDVEPNQVGRFLRTAVKDLVPLNQLSRGKPPGTFIVTNGRILAAYSLGTGLFLKIQDVAPPPASEAPKEAKIKNFKAVLLLTAIDGGAPAYFEAIPDENMVVVKRNLEVIIG
jgi:predicted glutamine amidotransferase